MSKKPDTLDDMVTYLRCARDSLLLVHDAIEENRTEQSVLLGAVYSAYVQLGWIVSSMEKQLEKIPAEIIYKAGEEVPAITAGSEA